MHVILLGHGSRDPRHATTIEALASTLDEQSLRASVSVAFLDLCPPTLTEAVGALAQGEDVVVVPMLLTQAFHAQVDVPGAVDAALVARPDVTVRLACVLGPDPRLVEAMESRLRAAGVDLDDPTIGVLLVAAGTSDPAAREEIAGVAHEWLAPPRRGAYAFAAGTPGADEAIRALVAAGARRVAIAPYLLADGVLPDRAFAQAERTAAELGVDLLVAGVLGDAPQVLDVVRERARDAAS